MQEKPSSVTNCYIDKTAVLEEGIKGFPSLFIEGAAASGKTVAVKILCGNHLEVQVKRFGMAFICTQGSAEQEKFIKEIGEILNERLALAESDFGETDTHAVLATSGSKEYRPLWTVFENIPSNMPEAVQKALLHFLMRLPDGIGDRAFLLSRNEPADALLGLLWKRRMEWIPQSVLMLDQRDVADLSAAYGSPLRVRELYQMASGWPGCTDMILRLAARDASLDEKLVKRSAADYLHRREVIDYIYSAILDTLPGSEAAVLQIAASYPWINAQFCADIFQIPDADEDIRHLERKGLLINYGKYQERWAAIHMLREAIYTRLKADEKASEGGHGAEEPKYRHYADRRRLASISRWYEAHNDLNHAGIILEQIHDLDTGRAFVERNYHRISFYDFRLDAELFTGSRTPYNVFLKGMKSLLDGDTEELHRQMSILRSMWNADRENSIMIQECYLNLAYVDPAISLAEWMQMLESIGSNILHESGRKARIFDFLGFGISYLCGLRDLSGLFACKKKEENAQAAIWNSYLDDYSMLGYRLAKIEYYVETDRTDEVREEIGRDLLEMNVMDDAHISFRDITARWLLISRLNNSYGFNQLSYEEGRYYDVVFREGDDFSREIIQDLQNIFAFRKGHPEMLSHWLRDEKYEIPPVSERNYCILLSKANGFMILKQYDRARLIFALLDTYLRQTGRFRLHAEVLFALGIIDLEIGRRGEALQRIIESMIQGRTYRYVRMYTTFGAAGAEALELYNSWMERNAPGGFRRKKKYNYGSVLRMPDADYVDVLLRETRKAGRKNKEAQPKNRSSEEKLTVMETVILQNISRGLTNAEICEELNLKLSTVKSHLYSLYKKLGVQNRMSAVNKGKEMGLISG